MTGSHDDPDISDAWDEFGDAGYVVFFVILEIYGQEFSHLDNDKKLTISKAFLRRKLRKSWTKVEQILNFYQEKKRIFYSTNGKQVSIEIPKYIDLSSNWTKWGKKRPKKAPTQAPTKNQSIEVEEEVEEEVETNKGVCPYLDILKAYHEVLPELPMVKNLTVTRKRQLNARWRSKARYRDIDWWRGFFNHVRGSSFLMGSKTDFQADLEWMTKESNFTKILEGKYHRG